MRRKIRTTADKRQFLQELAAGKARLQELLPVEHKLSFHHEYDEGIVEGLVIDEKTEAFVPDGKTLTRRELDEEKKNRRVAAPGEGADVIHHMVIFQNFSRMPDLYSDKLKKQSHG